MTDNNNDTPIYNKLMNGGEDNSSKAINKIKRVAKMIAAFVGALLTAGAVFIPVEWNGWIGLGMAIVTAIATYKIPNK